MTGTEQQTPPPEDSTASETPQTPQTSESAGTEAAAPSAEAVLATEVAALKDRLLRTMAEMENLRKRGEREREDAAKYGISSFARELLTVADNLRRALDSLPADAAAAEPIKSFADGVEMTERELLRVFEKAGIQILDPLGGKFDHNFHEAMFEVPTPDQPSGTVIQVVQPGYVIHDRLLRPARVGVSKAVSGQPEQKVDTKV